MHIVQVSIKVKSGFEEQFEEITSYNAINSRKEPGVVRFDFCREKDVPGSYQLIEVYRHTEDIAVHKESGHYLRWLEIAEPLMAEPRTRGFYENISPTDNEW